MIVGDASTTASGASMTVSDCLTSGVFESSMTRSLRRLLLRYSMFPLPLFSASMGTTAIGD